MRSSKGGWENAGWIAPMCSIARANGLRPSEGIQSGAKVAGMAGLLPHDMRWSAVRNFRRAGLSEHEGMKLSGHETGSIYRRYDIISDDDLTESMNQVQEHLKKEAANRKVVPLNKRQA